MRISFALTLVFVGSSAAFTNPIATKAYHHLATLRASETDTDQDQQTPNLEPANLGSRTTQQQEQQKSGQVNLSAPLEQQKPAVASPSRSVNNNRQMSESLPFMERPAALDGTLAGDVGFDPLGFAKSKNDLMNYREAEIKHARLAMLAAAGWPLSEVLDKKIAAALSLPPILDGSDRAPSLLNGGLGKISPLYWVVTLLAAAAIDFYGIQRSNNNAPGYFPGNLGFDPLGVYPKDAQGQKWMQLAEIKNGRLAMVAITAFAFQEFVTKSGVVDQTPIFFKPANEALQEYANTGYIPH